MSGPRFSIVPGDIIFDDTLQARDLQVLLLLGRHIDDAGWCRRSQVRMSRELRCGRATVQRALDRLVEAGWVEVKSVTPEGEHERSSHFYRVKFEDRPRLAAASDENNHPENTSDPAHQERAGGVPTSGHGCPPMDGHITTPLNEQGRESASARGQEPSLPHADLLADLRKLAPTAAHDSVSETEAAWRALSPSDRHDAVRRYPEWLSAKGARKAIAGLPAYLSEKRWTLLGGEKATPPEADSGRVPAFDRTWWWVWARAVSRGLTVGDRRHISGALTFGGAWQVDPAKRPAYDEAAERELIGHRIDSSHVAAWRAHYRSQGVDMPTPSKAEWIYLPPTGPPVAASEPANQSRAEAKFEGVR